MGVSGPKYAGVPAGAGGGGPVQSEIPVVPVAAAVSSSGSGTSRDAAGHHLPTALKVDDFRSRADEHEHDDGGVTVTWEKGEVQPSAYRDKWFAIAFVAHLAIVAATAAAYGPAAWRAGSELVDELNEEAAGQGQGGEGAAYDESTSSDGDDGSPPKEFWFAAVAVAMVAAPALSLAALTLMSRNAIGLIKGSLWFSVVLCGLSAVVLLAVAPFIGILYGVFTVCLIWYARSVRSRIPYAASNLKCGIAVLKNNMGLGIVALGSMAVLLAYSLGWAWAFAGAMTLDSMYADADGTTSYDAYSSDDGGSEGGDLSPLGAFVGFFFLLSFYWSHEVLRNVVRATVSGVVGTWWFDPSEASSFCSSAVSGSLVRSTTYSLGSICFGSLIVAVLHMLRNTLRRAQNDRNGGGILRCIAMCILAWVERLVEYFNKWAYIYVGLYGYGYVEAGRKVIGLFKTRGWDVIISDNLVNRLLGIMSLTIGLLTGACSLLAAFLVEEFESQQGWAGIGFVVGFFVGLILSGVFMGLLSSAVDAIIVCYAEAPKELEESHPKVAQEMSRTWTEAWGSQAGVVLVSLGGGLGIV